MVRRLSPALALCVLACGGGDAPPDARIDARPVIDAAQPIDATPPPATPTGLTATPGDEQVTLNWSPSAGADSYRVMYSLVAGGSYIDAGLVTATTYTHTGLANLQDYFYVVSAVNSGGESTPSSEAQARPVGPFDLWTVVEYAPSYRDVAANGANLVAVGALGVIRTSSDGGGTWTVRDSGTRVDLGAVVFGGGQFVAVGSEVVLTSPDGVSWTRRDVPNFLFRDVTYDGTAFLALDPFTIRRSTDAVTWTVVANIPVGPSMTAIAGGAEGTVVVGFGGRVGHAPDGVTWTFGTGAAATVSFSGVVYAEGMFVAAGSNGAYTSAVGTSWTVVSPSPTGSVIAHGAGTFVLFSGQNAYTSPDAAAWTPIVFANRYGATAAAHDGMRMVAVGDAGLVSQSNPAIDSWTVLSESVYLREVDAGTRFTAVGDYGTILTSDAGAIWTPRNSGTIQSLNAVASLGSVVVATGNGVAVTSEDGGVNWTVRTTSLPRDPSAIAAGAGIFVAVGTFGADGFIMTSSDGQSWSAPVTYNGALFQDVVFDGTYFVVVGAQVYRSNNGTTWERCEDAPGAEVVAWDGSRVVANGLALGGVAYASTDSGLNWGPVETTPLQYDHGDSAGGGGAVVASGVAMLTVFSTGGAWRIANVFTRGGFHGLFPTGMAARGSRFVMVGTSGLIAIKDYP